MTNQDVCKQLPKAKALIVPVLEELDKRSEAHGHIHFEDVVEAVNMFVDPSHEALFEAMKRVAECSRCITIHDMERV